MDWQPCVLKRSAIMSRSGYTIERLSEAATLAAGSVGAPEGVTLTCRYLGVVSGEDSIEADGLLARRAKVAFEWRMAGPGVEQHCRVDARCGDACSRGVPFPAAWRYTASRMAEAASKAVARAAAPAGVSITCRSAAPIHTMCISCAY